MDLSTIKNTGNWGSSASRLNDNFSKVGTEVDKLKYAAYNSKLYASEALLKQAIPSPSVGDWAIVGNSIPGEIYRCDTDGEWTATGQTGGGYGMEVTEKHVTEQYVTEVHNEYTGDIVNNPDDEDLISEELAEGGKVLKLADKAYNASAFSGLGRVYLRKNVTASKNILTQAMISNANTRYVIQYDYDLNGQTITIPEGCVLDFQGGSMKNGVLMLNQTEIVTTQPGIFHSSLTLQGGMTGDTFPMRWWGVRPDGTSDFRQLIQCAVDVLSAGSVVFDEGTYLIKGVRDKIETSPYPGVSRQLDGITPKSNVSYKGNRTTLLCDESSYYIFSTRFTSSSDADLVLENVSFEGITFRYGGSSFIEHSHHLNIESARNLRIRDCDFIGWRGDAACFGFRNDPTYSRVVPVVVENVTIDNCNFDGVAKNNRQALSFLYADGVRITNCTFSNTSKSDMPGAIDFEPELADSAVVRNVYIDRCRFSHIGGMVGCVAFVVERSKSVSNINVTNCVMEDSSYGIAVYGKAGTEYDVPVTSPHGFVISGNTMRNVIVYCFSIGGVYDVTLHRNSFSADEGKKVYASNIGMTVGSKKYYCNNVNIMDNTFSNLLVNMDYASPLLINYSKGISIIRNIVNDCGFESATTSGYAMFHSSDKLISDMLISGNVFNNSQNRTCYIAIRGNMTLTYPESIRFYDNVRMGTKGVSSELSFLNQCDVREHSLTIGNGKFSKSNVYDETTLPNSMATGIHIGQATDGGNLFTVKGNTYSADYAMTYQLKLDKNNPQRLQIRYAADGNTWTAFKSFSGS